MYIFKLYENSHSSKPFSCIPSNHGDTSTKNYYAVESRERALFLTNFGINIR